jgi:hypothetical protein
MSGIGERHPISFTIQQLETRFNLIRMTKMSLICVIVFPTPGIVVVDAQ